MDNYQKLLNNLENRPTPEGLHRAILLRLNTEQKKAVRKRFFVAGLSFVVSFGATATAVSILMINLAQSGFWKFVSLMFSDGGTVLSYWQQFSLSLLESFSIPEMIVSLVCVLAVMLSLKFLLKNKSAFSFQSSQLQTI